MGQNPDNTCFCCSKSTTWNPYEDDKCECTKKELNKTAWSRLLELQDKYHV